MHCMSVGFGRKEESYIGCLCVSHRACGGEYCATLPLYGLHSCMCMSTACYNSLSLFSYHSPAFLALDPLVDYLVACQRLTSLELGILTLSLQNLLSLVKGLHNLRALGLVRVSLSNERVSY